MTKPLIPPTYDELLELFHRQEQLLASVKKEYIDYINEDAERSKTTSSFRLSIARRAYLLRMGNGNLTKGVNKVIDDHMLGRGMEGDK